MKGDVAMLRSLLDAYEGNVMDVVSLPSTKEGQTVLHILCERGHIDAAQTLLSIVPHSAAPILLDRTDQHGQTPLHSAATSTSVNALHLLEYLVPLSTHASLHHANKDGLMPLAAAIMTCASDDASITRLFLQHQVDANTMVHHKNRTNTLLHIAVERKLWNIACVLLEFGANWNLEDDSGNMVTDVLTDIELQTLIQHVAFPQPWATNIRMRCQSSTCSTWFSLLQRRHHCRLCGRVLCSHCTKFRERLFVGGKEITPPVRVCRICADVPRERPIAYQRYDNDNYDDNHNNFSIASDASTFSSEIHIMEEYSDIYIMEE
jgi:hypothetical protein